MTDIYDFTVRDLNGGEHLLAEYRGKVLLIVNTASQCGFTPQYAGLEALHRKYADKGFEVLGFPCNQFGLQEPGNAAEIASFCSLHYDVSFPMFARLNVNGLRADPLYTYLKKARRGLLGSKSIKWNFTKFLVERDGKVRARFAPFVTPGRLDAVIAKLL